MRIPDLLIIEFFTINTLATSTIAVREITALRHKALDNSMENTVFVAKTFTMLHCTQLSEVFCSFWYLLREDLKDNATFFFFFTLVADLNIEESLYIFCLVFWQLTACLNIFGSFFFIVNSTTCKHLLHLSGI